LRTFALARIDKVTGSEGTAHRISADMLKAHFGASYGLFAGEATHTATLRFRASIAREIAMQVWHPLQQGDWDGDEYVLRLPYSDPRELVRDVMRYVPEVVVEGPEELRERVVECLVKGLQDFQKT
jgi:predicted DNA-binding transcriptional regulator YafY